MDDLRVIPRLVDTDGHTAVPRGTRDENLDPGSWSCDDVAQFLEINEIKCDPLVEAIIEQVSFIVLLYEFFPYEVLLYSRKSFDRGFLVFRI